MGFHRTLSGPVVRAWSRASAVSPRRPRLYRAGNAPGGCGSRERSDTRPAACVSRPHRNRDVDRGPGFGWARAHRPTRANCQRCAVAGAGSLRPAGDRIPQPVDRPDVLVNELLRRMDCSYSLWQSPAARRHFSERSKPSHERGAPQPGDSSARRQSRSILFVRGWRHGRHSLLQRPTNSDCPDSCDAAPRCAWRRDPFPRRDLSRR